MKKYVTFVKDAEESRKVQEALFKAGFHWHSAGETVINTHGKFLLINTECDKTLGYVVDDIDWILSHSNAEQWVGIKSQHIISDPFQLDGAKQPEKMVVVGGVEYSESTLQMMIREHGK